MNRFCCIIMSCGVAFTLCSCMSSGEKLVPVSGNEQVIGTINDAPHLIVYKTTKDYSHNVAVTLSADSKRIVSYPAPSDVTASSVPIKLEGGYWLDRRGLSKYTAYLSYTNDEYSSLQKTPSVEELEEKIIDYNPIIEMWDCGNEYEIGSADLLDSLNKIVLSEFKGCKRIK